MEFVLGFILGLGWWFWSLAAIEFGFLILLVENDMGIESIVSFIIFLVAIWFLTDIPIWAWIKNNPGQLAMYCLYYFLIGLLWAVGKYYALLKELKTDILRAKEKYEKYKVEQPDSIMYSSFEDYWDGMYDSPRVKFDRTISKVAFWAAWWPPSMFWTLVDDIFVKFFNFMINDVFIGMFKAMYKSMVEKYMKG